MLYRGKKCDLYFKFFCLDIHHFEQHLLGEIRADDHYLNLEQD